MNYKKHLIVASLSILFGSGCANKPPIVQTVTEYASIPAQFNHLLSVPAVPTADVDGTITVNEALKSASDLRTHACYLRSRYRELLRVATFGKSIMDLPGEAECPNMANRGIL